MHCVVAVGGGDRQAVLEQLDCIAIVVWHPGWPTGMEPRVFCNVRFGSRVQTVVDALIRTARKLPNELYKSLTWDRGKEMADHRRFTLATDIQI